MASLSKKEISSSGSLLHVIEREHCAEMHLCGLIERLADALPEPLDNEIATAGIAMLRKCVKRHIILQEHYLYPILVKRTKPDEFNNDMLDIITREHASDESHAHEAADKLEEALTHGHVSNPEMLGYMLRCYFEARRRHIAWENAMIMPLARQRLRESDFSEFSDTDLKQGQGLFAGLSVDSRCC